MNTRMISNMRVILALATLLVIYIDPSEPQRFVAATYSALVLYNIYAATMYLLSRRDHALVPIKFAHWIDIIFCLVLLALGTGTSSIFFFQFFFGILVASFRFGFMEGLRATVFSAVMFTIVGYLTAPAGEEFELNRFLLKPVYLCVLGYMIAYWGGWELKYKERLAILKDINKLYNPRFGIDQTMNAFLQKILFSFDAYACLLITANADMSSYKLRQSYRENPDQALHAEQINSDSPLITLPCEYAVIYHNFRQIWAQDNTNYLVFDLQSGKRVEEPRRNGELLADLLETQSFISVPLCLRETVVWRLYLISQTKIFDYSDVEFLRQLLEQAFPVTENVNLLDRLASEATEQQRQKISRDIHDSTVQPYIGIKLGLEALQIKQAAGESIADGISQLINLAETNILEIRSYINRLRGDKSDVKAGNVLVSAIRQQAKKISEFYGIQIEVFAEDNLINISDRLSAEVFQIVTESLSNIKRHTKADHASIFIEANNKRLKIEIQNNNLNGDKVLDFVPKSISGRANALGGQAFVENKDHHTTVSVEIPL
ncbi:MAG: histidine kinase [Acidobacteria bacterium]|nr:histidine kinase [Acidobacteriota bacterium]